MNWRSFPFFAQMDSMDCGPACLQMIAHYHSKSYQLADLRAWCHLDREGVSLKGIATGAERIGYRTLAVKIPFTAKASLPSLANAPLPIILHWNQNHIAVTDLLGKPPGWLLRSGITLVFGTVVLGLLLAAFINYPDKLSGSVVIQYDQPPVSLTAALTAPLDTLLVQDGDSVATHQMLGVLRSDANWQEVRQLATHLASAHLPDDQEMTAGFTQLGSLQAAYSDWRDAHRAWHHYRENNGLAAQNSTLHKELQYTRELLRIGEAQLALLDRQLVLETSDYQRQQTLAKAGVVSTQALEEKEKAWLAVRQQRENLSTGQIQHQLRIAALDQQQEVATREHHDARFALAQNLQQRTASLYGQLQAWQERYCLLAPIAGKVVLSAQLVEKEMLTAGQVLLSILPPTTAEQQLLAHLQLPAQGMGKIAVCDRVIIRLEAYPEQEYGTLSTRVQHITALPQVAADGQSYYELEAAIPQPLTTEYNKVIPVAALMSGTATVITEDRSILSRIFAQLRELIQMENY